MLVAAGVILLWKLSVSAQPPSGHVEHKRVLLAEIDEFDANGSLDRENLESPLNGRVLNLPKTPFNYADIKLPEHFQSDFVQRLDNTPRDNPLTDHGVTLGRVLFYDTKLSANNKTACASCHLQENAFADPKQSSVGFEGKPVDRNAMSLVNAGFYANGRFFWDERAATPFSRRYFNKRSVTTK